MDFDEFTWNVPMTEKECTDILSAIFK